MNLDWTIEANHDTPSYRKEATMTQTEMKEETKRVVENRLRVLEEAMKRRQQEARKHEQKKQASG